MEIRYLRLIKAIVEEGSITRAMDVLFLSQSALSYQLKEAELQIGTKLFFRVNKKLVLTPAGKKLYSTATRVLAELDETEDEIRRMMDGESGTIRISTECYTSYHWLPPVLKKFKSEFPNVEIEIVFEATHHPVEKLLAGELDLAITSNPEHPEQIEFIQLFSDEMLAVVSHQHPWAKREYVVSEDFQDATLIIHSLPLDTVSIFRTQLTPKGLQPKKLIILPLTEASIELVKANMGVIVLANWAMKPYINGQVKAVRINPEGFFRQQYIARMRNRKYPVYFDYFIRFLREELRTNAETKTPQ
ncbi:LysR family transcriptional regulator [Parapedobacter indicus]|uniref:LysR family transcriptional regulator, regulator for metE and metH n=1 Tax=Parapedobacter indicus TaxID=1477437 RepID=A0A1I3TX50_9SPHI|nr:LysR family transcriptional regulator [Parapedobacter indicus]PPK99464.1 LysR family transcriptional regulator for metE and metH [Parapedobacter indicus]SFJ75824.1 LysR family transcriptional regulator, regulator for metE and metH [Parapedobacter indicus]